MTCTLAMVCAFRERWCRKGIVAVGDGAAMSIPKSGGHFAAGKFRGLWLFAMTIGRKT